MTSSTPSFPKCLINSSPFTNIPQNHNSRNSVMCCHKSSLSSRMNRETGYITSYGSYTTWQPTRSTTPSRSPDHTSLPFTTRWYATIIRHRSAPKRRRSTRPDTAIIRPSKPRSSRLGNSSLAWSKTRGYGSSRGPRNITPSSPRGKC